MRFVDVIRKKRDGEALSEEEIEAFVSAYTAGEIPDYQASAFLMACFLRGLNDEETSALTDAMMHSGEVIEWKLPHTVDKHSTGGVGDGVSLAIAPIVAACGGKVAMMSGRGLGHTGGTLDKLESIPGYCAQISADRFQEIVKEVGASIIGQTERLAPADKKLYALRDATGTVESIPLITASILGKKLAEGVDALVLDVKAGSGAFMKTEAEAKQLAKTMCAIAGALKAYGPKAVVVDPVMVSTSGHVLMPPGAIDAFRRYLVPLATLLTPNVPEAEVLSGLTVSDEASCHAAGLVMARDSRCPVLIKGGHFGGQDKVDRLYAADGRLAEAYATEAVDTPNTHGTGCTLSSAIACFIARGLPLADAVRQAKAYVTEALKAGSGVEIGQGHGPVNHFFNPEKMLKV